MEYETNDMFLKIEIIKQICQIRCFKGKYKIFRTYSDFGKYRWQFLHRQTWDFPKEEFCNLHFWILELADQCHSRSDQHSSEWTLRTRNLPPTKPNPATRPLSFLECTWRWFDLSRWQNGWRCGQVGPQTVHILLHSNCNPYTSLECWKPNL